MDKMCELAKAVSDLKLTRNEIRKGLSGFEVLTISKRCKTTVNETCELIERLLENNTNIKFLKNKEAKKNNYRIEDLENTPAYMRKNVDISSTTMTPSVSRSSISLDSNNIAQIRENNSYLHDNVD